MHPILRWKLSLNETHNCKSSHAYVMNLESKGQIYICFCDLQQEYILLSDPFAKIDI